MSPRQPIPCGLDSTHAHLTHRADAVLGRVRDTARNGPPINRFNRLSKWKLRSLCGLLPGISVRFGRDLPGCRRCGVP